jgi:hypothetical protein
MAATIALVVNSLTLLLIKDQQGLIRMLSVGLYGPRKFFQIIIENMGCLLHFLIDYRFIISGRHRLII